MPDAPLSPTPPAGAVFLSYASQDAPVVLGIAEALRAEGVEVWFDQNELVGGDAWDAKIRGQIKGCALFVPVISATTQARQEGYFRREWKLAVDRMQDMDEGVPFLLPIALDGVNENGAFVPEVFLKVQWTKLAGATARRRRAGSVSRLAQGPRGGGGRECGTGFCFHESVPSSATDSRRAAAGRDRSPGRGLGTEAGAGGERADVGTVAGGVGAV